MTPSTQEQRQWHTLSGWSRCVWTGQRGNGRRDDVVSGLLGIVGDSCFAVHLYNAAVDNWINVLTRTATRKVQSLSFAPSTGWFAVGDKGADGSAGDVFLYAQNADGATWSLDTNALALFCARRDFDKQWRSDRGWREWRRLLTRVRYCEQRRVGRDGHFWRNMSNSMYGASASVVSVVSADGTCAAPRDPGRS